MDEKAALRKHHAEHPKVSQKDLRTWFEGSFNKPIRRATVSEILSDRYLHLDSQIARSQAVRKRQRLAAYTDLENALSQWFFACEASPSLITSGEALKAKATLFWHRLPQYQGQPVPSFSEGGLPILSAGTTLGRLRATARQRALMTVV